MVKLKKKKEKKIRHYGSLFYLFMAVLMFILIILNIVDLYIYDMKHVYGNPSTMILSIITFGTNLSLFFAGMN